MVNFDDPTDARMCKALDFDMAEVIPTISKGYLAMRAEKQLYSQFIEKCSTVPIPSYVKNPESNFDSNFRLNLEDDDFAMKVIINIKIIVKIIILLRSVIADHRKLWYHVRGYTLNRGIYCHYFQNTIFIKP